MRSLIDPEDEKNLDNIQSDYDRSRETYHDLIEKGKDALEMMIEVARESEHPRAFEVLATLIKSTSDVNDKLMVLNKAKKDLLAPADKNTPALPGATTTNNNVFIGSTSDLQRMLQDVTKQEEDAKLIEAEVIDITPDEEDA
jgi:hypothetical protein